MVNIYLLNPAHKLRFLSKLIAKGSTRMLDQGAITGPVVTLAQEFELEAKARRSSTRPTPSQPLVRAALSPTPVENLKRDEQYYMEDLEGGFCIFRVENTLFRVHRCLLLREPSAFEDMFSFPRAPGNVEGLFDSSPIPLTDSVDQFRDLMWALYAVPSQLCAMDANNGPSLSRLLNIIQITHKYCIASYERWAVDRLVSLARDEGSFLRKESGRVCARVLDVAVLVGHHELLELLTQRLIYRVLWSDIDRVALLKVAEDRGLDKLRGVIYYRDLVEWEKAALDSALLSGPKDRSVYIPRLEASKQTSFLAAHGSLVDLWEHIRATSPSFSPDTKCTHHSRCVGTWNYLWQDAGVSQQTMKHASADVLNKLKSMMIRLKKTAPSSRTMSVGCVLAALEAITALRDEVISGMTDHFSKHQSV